MSLLCDFVVGSGFSVVEVVGVRFLLVFVDGVTFVSEYSRGGGFGRDRGDVKFFVV